jgi:hypothetical protein
LKDKSINVNAKDQNLGLHTSTWDLITFRNTALHYSAESGNDKQIQVLLSHGSNVNERNSIGFVISIKQLTVIKSNSIVFSSCQ